MKGRPRNIWEYDLRMNLGEREWEAVDWIHLAHDRGQWRTVVKKLMKLWVP